MINGSYNPKRAYYHQFLEELSINIDHAIVENKPLTMMGDYNKNHLNQSDREDLETVILPFELTTINTDQPTKIGNKSGSLIDYIITDHYNINSYSILLSDTAFRTSTNELIDHFATCCKSNIE